VLWRRPLFLVGAALLVLLAIYAATVAEVISIWTSSDTYQFSWIVIPTFAYLLLHNRAQFRAYQASGSALGIVLAIACALLWVVGELIDIGLLRQLALLLGIMAVVLAGTGRPLFVALVPTLALLVLLVPLGDLFLSPLKYFLIQFTEGFATLAGLPFSRDGFSFFVGDNDYVVIDDCAGLAYFLSGLFLGLTFAGLIYRSWWKILFLTVLGGSLGILANGLRVCGIVLYDHITGSQMSVSDHSYFELLTVPLCLIILFIVFSRLKAEPPGVDELSPQADAPLKPVTTRSAAATIIAVAILALAPIVTSGMPAIAYDDSVALSLPETLGAWHKQQPTGSQWQPQISSSGVLQSQASYAVADRAVSVFVAQPGSPPAKISAGAVNLAGAKGWFHGGVEATQFCHDDHCIEILKHTLRPSVGDNVRYVYSTYILDKQSIVSPLQLRAQLAWNRWRGNSSPPRLIAIMQEGTQSIGSEELADIIFMLARPT